MKIKDFWSGIKRLKLLPYALAGVLLLSALLWLLLSRPGPDVLPRLRRPAPEVVLALVNGVPITVSGFQARMAALPAYYQPYAAANRSQFLQDLIDREIIYQQARRSRHVRNQQIIEQVEDFRKELLIQKYVRHEILERVDLSEPELKAYYQDNLTTFFQPASVHLYEIMVPRRQTAEQVRSDFRDGRMSFEDLAREYSQVPSGNMGGDLGFIREGDLSPELEAVAFNLAPGEVSPVISTDIGYYLLLAKHKIPGRQLDFQEARPLIERMLSSRGEEERFRVFLRDLKGSSKIRILEENLEKMDL